MSYSRARLWEGHIISLINVDLAVASSQDITASVGFFLWCKGVVCREPATANIYLVWLFFWDWLYILRHISCLSVYIRIYTWHWKNSALCFLYIIYLAKFFDACICIGLALASGLTLSNSMFGRNYRRVLNWVFRGSLYRRCNLKCLRGQPQKELLINKRLI